MLDRRGTVLLQELIVSSLSQAEAHANPVIERGYIEEKLMATIRLGDPGSEAYFKFQHGDTVMIKRAEGIDPVAKGRIVSGITEAEQGSRSDPIYGVKRFEDSIYYQATEMELIKVDE